MMTARGELVAGLDRQLAGRRLAMNNNYTRKRTPLVVVAPSCRLLAGLL